MNGTTYDLKVGYGCNNRCFHCVIEPYKQKPTLPSHDSIDYNYRELIEIMKSPSFINSSLVVITGGEPTVRKDFVRIISYINSKYPHKRIELQTNGRVLYKYLMDLHCCNIQYVIALHGLEATHNIISNALEGNPFMETWHTIQELKKLKDNVNRQLRIEIVMSSINLKEVPDLVRFLITEEIFNIGISYPHLDGYYETNKDLAQNIGFHYTELYSVLEELVEISSNTEALTLIMEAVPACVWRNIKGELLKLPKNIKAMGQGNEGNITVAYPDHKICNDFNEIKSSMKRKDYFCGDCELTGKCWGFWYEALEMGFTKGLMPVDKAEREWARCI